MQLHCQLFTIEVQVPPLEALLSDLPVFSIGHLAQSVGIAAPVVGSRAPEHLCTLKVTRQNY